MPSPLQAVRSSGVDLRRILELARPEARRLALATVALFVSSGMTLLYPQAVRFLVDALVGGEAPFSIDSGALLLVAVFAILWPAPGSNPKTAIQPPHHSR